MFIIQTVQMKYVKRGLLLLFVKNKTGRWFGNAVKAMRILACTLLQDELSIQQMAALTNTIILQTQCFCIVFCRLVSFDSQYCQLQQFCDQRTLKNKIIIFIKYILIITKKQCYCFYMESTSLPNTSGSKISLAGRKWKE